MPQAALRQIEVEPDSPPAAPPPPPERGPIDHRKVMPSFDFKALLKGVVEQHGKSYFNQVAEIYRLKFGPGKIAPVEYFHYRLFDDAVPMKRKLAFVGTNLRAEVNNTLLDKSLFEVGIDKLMFYARAAEAGLPLPETVAVHHADRTVPGAAALPTAALFADWLRAEAAYPIFCKPAKLTASVGAASLDRYHMDADEIELADGRRFPVERFVAEAQRYFKNGYLAQARLAPHPALAAVAAPRASTVRIMVLADPEPKVLRATWRLPVGMEQADVAWRGNMMADIDLETGAVTRAVRGRALTLAETPVHPETGAMLVGFKLPDWAAAKAAALRGAAAFPELPLTGWDVCLTDAGPVLIELEPDGGDPAVTQLASNRGLLDGPYGDWLRRGLRAANRG